MRLLNMVVKCYREQKRDLWMLGLSLAFTPLFVVIYYLMTGGTGSTSYSVLVINQDQPARRARGATLAAGEEIIQGLRGLSYKNGSPLLKVALTEDQAQADAGRRGWTFERVAGDLVLIRRLLYGDWERDFLVLEPGQQLTMTYDDEIIGCLLVEGV